MSMNPFNLLTKGHTIRGTKDIGHYKLLTKSPLPNFSANKGAKANPITSHVIREAKQSALFEQAKPAHVPAPALKALQLTVKPALPFAEAVKPVGRGSCRAIGGETCSAGASPYRNPANPATKAAAVAPAIAEAQAKPAVWSKWADVAAGWMRQWSLGRKPSPMPPPAVQTELALEKVKVIRNDLAEDDLEVVAVNAKAGKEAKPAREKKAIQEQEQQQASARP